MRVFNSYVQFCNYAYWGPTGGPNIPKINTNKKSDHNKNINSMERMCTLRVLS